MLRLASVLLGLLIALGLIEILGRVIGFLPTQPTSAYQRLVQHVGPLPEPSSRLIYASAGGEFRNILHFNALGFRDPRGDFPPRRRDTDRHILVLGDSYTAAWQVPLFERWTERITAARSGWITLNTGTPTWGTDREYFTFVHYPLAHEPDVVLLAMYPGNDPYDAATAMFVRPPARPYFVPTGLAVDGIALLKEIESSAPPPPLPIDDATTWLRYHSVLWYAGEELAALTAPPARQPPPRALKKLAPELEVFQRNNEELSWRSAWLITDGLLSLLKAEADRRRIRLAIVLIPYHGAIQPELISEFIQRDPTAFDFSIPYRRIATTAQKLGVELLDLTPGFAAFHATDPQQRTLFLPGDKHFSPLGNCVAAALIGSWLDPSLPPLSTDACRE